MFTTSYTTGNDTERHVFEAIEFDGL
jgi:hypothetical protein